MQKMAVVSGIYGLYLGLPFILKWVLDIMIWSEWFGLLKFLQSYYRSSTKDVRDSLSFINCDLVFIFQVC